MRVTECREGKLELAKKAGGGVESKGGLEVLNVTEAQRIITYAASLTVGTEISVKLSVFNRQ